MRSAALAAREPADTTRERILAAALQAFAETGFEGTPLSRIAAFADTTQSLIHYHFGSKRELWDLLQHRLVLDLAAMAAEADEQADGVSLIEAWARRLFAYLEDRPQFVRLVCWLEVGGAGSLAQQPVAELVSAVVARIRSEQQAGRLRPDVGPVHICIMLQQTLVGWFRAQMFLGSVLPVDRQQAGRAFLEDVLRMLCASLAIVPSAAAVEEVSPALHPEARDDHENERPCRPHRSKTIRKT